MGAIEGKNLAPESPMRQRMRLLSAVLFLLPWPCRSFPHAQAAEGLVVESATEPFPAARELSNRLAEIQSESQDMRSRVLTIQDYLASRMKDAVTLSIAVEARDEPSFRPLSFVELSATLNDIGLVNYRNPLFHERDKRLPVFEGPLPTGQYRLRIQAIVGLLQHGWPYALSQGRWLIDKTFPLILDGKTNSKRMLVVVKPGATEPLVSVEEQQGAGK